MTNLKVKPFYTTPLGGAYLGDALDLIPPNLITCGNNDANGHYLSRCPCEGKKPHPARFPPPVPQFFIRFLTIRW